VGKPKKLNISGGL